MYCANCEGPIKPKITFFGEGLPAKFGEAYDHIKKDSADLCIVMGTGLAVAPFNGAAKIGDKDGNFMPRVLMNLENTAESGYDFANPEKYPERLWLNGKCDDTIRTICKQLGWEEDL